MKFILICLIGFIGRLNSMEAGLPENLEAPEVSKFTVELKFHKCDYEDCTKTYTSKYNMTRHRLKSHGVLQSNRSKSSKPGVHACGYGTDREDGGCRKKFISLKNLDKHRIEYHTLGRYECASPCCTDVFDSKWELIQHEEYVHDNIRYRCRMDGCKSAFTLEKNLVIHMCRVHNDFGAVIKWRAMNREVTTYFKD